MTANEYATFVYYWPGDPQPDRVPDLLSTLDTAEWAQAEACDLQVAGAVQALGEAVPHLKHRWKADFPRLYQRVKKALESSPKNPQWTEFHLTQWFILRRESSLDAILDIIANNDGEVSQYAARSLEKNAHDSVPLRKALQAARRAREASMLIQ